MLKAVVRARDFLCRDTCFEGDYHAIDRLSVRHISCFSRCAIINQSIRALEGSLKDHDWAKYDPRERCTV